MVTTAHDKQNMEKMLLHFELEDTLRQKELDQVHLACRTQFWNS